MAAIAPAGGQGGTDDDLVQKFVQYVQARPDASNVTLDEIRNSVLSSNSAPTGRDALEQLLSQPVGSGMWPRRATGKTTVTMSGGQTTIEFTLDNPINGVDTISVTSTAPQMTQGTFSDLPSALMYKKETDLVRGASLNSAFYTMNGSNAFTSVFSYPNGGPEEFELKCEGADFNVRPGFGTAAWS